jgi:hypothetical protein
MEEPLKEPEVPPEFFKKAEEKLAFEKCEEAYFSMFDKAAGNGIPPGYVLAMAKDSLCTDSDGNFRVITAQLDYMFLRWQYVRGRI